MTEDKFDNMYEGRFDALQKKYEAEIAIAISASYFFSKHQIYFLFLNLHS